MTQAGSHPSGVVGRPRTRTAWGTWSTFPASAGLRLQIDAVVASIQAGPSRRPRSGGLALRPEELLPPPPPALRGSLHLLDLCSVGSVSAAAAPPEKLSSPFIRLQEDEPGGVRGGWMRRESDSKVPLWKQRGEHAAAPSAHLSTAPAGPAGDDSGRSRSTSPPHGPTGGAGWDSCSFISKDPLHAASAAPWQRRQFVGQRASAAAQRGPPPRSPGGRFRISPLASSPVPSSITQSLSSLLSLPLSL